MKKLQILAAILAIGTMCIAGCDMGGTSTSDNRTQPQSLNIVAQDESIEETPAPAPDDNCNKDGNCNRDKMPHAKPNFKFKAPNGKRGRGDKDKFRLPHKRPTPPPETPETPTEPKENTNN